MTIRGAGSVTIEGVTAQEVFDFVLDPAQYRKADTKIIDVTKLADTPDGMLTREDGLFLGRFRGSIVTRYRWDVPRRIDVTLVHGIPESMHAWFDIHETEQARAWSMSKKCAWATASSESRTTGSRVAGLPPQSSKRSLRSPA